MQKKMNEMLLQAIPFAWVADGHIDGEFSEVQEELCSDEWFATKAKWSTGTGRT